jgi:predicted transposase YbfD/YdcC
MNYSIAGWNLPQDADGVVFDVGSLYLLFRGLTDQRKRRGVRYELAVLLVALLLAKLAGETKPSGMADWVQERSALFLETFGLKRKRMPHHNTYRRVLQDAVVIEELEQVAQHFLGALPRTGMPVQICLDGKTVRGTIAFGETRGLHLLAAYLPGAGVVLCQVAVDTKTNEIGVAPRVLKMLDLRGKIVTGDAMFAQRTLSELIVEAGGEYVWTVKDNQSQLKADIELLFAEDHECVPGFSPAPTDFQTARQVTSGHGRIEKRTVTTSSLLKETCPWPGAEQVFKVERETRVVARGVTRTEVAYGLTSLSAAEAGPAQLLDLVRTHWQIENGLHYRRDVTLAEDACRVKQPSVAHALAILNNLALALLLRLHANAAKAQRYYAAHPDQALQLVFSHPTRL